MRHWVIWLTAGMLALWVAVMGGTIILDFDRVQQSNRTTAVLEWTFICDELTGNYASIEPIRGGKNFIAADYNAVNYEIINEKGRTLGWSYESLKPIGDGYVRFEETPTGIVIKDENGNNKRTRIGVLDDEGNVLPEEEAVEILERGEADESVEAIDGKYTVAKGDRKYVGVKDSTGNWLIPPAFHEIRLTDDGKYAVIKNGRNIGIAALEQ